MNAERPRNIKPDRKISDTNDCGNDGVKLNIFITYFLLALTYNLV